MTRYHGGGVVEGGWYLDTRTLAVTNLPARGKLPGSRRSAFVRVPLPALLPDGNGLVILEQFSGRYRDRIIVLTGTGSIETAVLSMKKGAHDFLQKPVEGFNVIGNGGIILDALRARSINFEVVEVSSAMRTRSSFGMVRVYGNGILLRFHGVGYSLGGMVTSSRLLMCYKS